MDRNLKLFKELIQCHEVRLLNFISVASAQYELINFTLLSACHLVDTYYLDKTWILKYSDDSEERCQVTKLEDGIIRTILDARKRCHMTAIPTAYGMDLINEMISNSNHIDSWMIGSYVRLYRLIDRDNISTLLTFSYGRGVEIIPGSPSTRYIPEKNETLIMSMGPNEGELVEVLDIISQEVGG